MNNVIKSYPQVLITPYYNDKVTYFYKVRLKQFIGNISYRGAEMKTRGVEPNPGPGDIRRLITEYCILPLGTITI